MGSHETTERPAALDPRDGLSRDAIRAASNRVLTPLALTAALVAAMPVASLATAGERSTPTLDLQGHRGARGLWPENTVEGFRETLALGVTTLELDVGATRDGVAVVHHDIRLHPDIARGADGLWLGPSTRAVHAHTWAELQVYEVGRLRPASAYAARFPEQRGRDGVRIPRLADVLADAERLCGGRMRYNVETKLDPDEPEATPEPARLADLVIRDLAEAGVTNRSTIQSFDWRSLRHVQKAAPQIQTACVTSEAPHEDTIRRGRPGASPWTAGLDVDDFGGSVPRLVQAAGCDIWSPRYQDLAIGDVKLAHALGLRVVPWTVDEPAAIEHVLRLGVDGIISDHPDRARAVMRAQGLTLPQPCVPRDEPA